MPHGLALLQGKCYLSGAEQSSDLHKHTYTMKTKALLLALLLPSLAAAQTDVTDTYMQNPDFAARYAGWLDEGTTKGAVGGFWHQINSEFAGKSGEVYMELWVSTGNKVGNATISQTLKDLPVGTYRLTAAAQNIQQNSSATQTGAYVFAGDEQTEVGAQADYSVTFTVVDGSAKVGFKTVSATGNWVCVDNFRLYRLSTDMDAVHAGLQKLIDDANDAMGTGSADAELEAAIAGAQALLPSSTESGVQEAAKALERATLSHRLGNATGGVPTVVTNPYVAMGATIALGRSTVTANGATISERGFCWSTDPEPTVLDERTTEYFTNNGNVYRMENLAPATIYYVRAYAMTSTYQVGYGDVVRMATKPKGEVTYWYNYGGSDEQNCRINSSFEECVWMYNNVAHITGFGISGNYNSGTATADCSYGGWMNVGPSESYQQTGTILHETNHGVGVGTTNEWYNNSNLRESTSSGKWLGPCANEMVQFLQNDATAFLTGDTQHMWGSTTSSITMKSYGINGASEDSYSPADQLLYWGNIFITHSLHIDGLPCSSSVGFACPSFVFEQWDGVKYYIKSEDASYGVTTFLGHDSSGTLQDITATMDEALADDNLAWYISFNPSTQYYTFQNAGSGRYISLSGGKLVAGTSAAEMHLLPSREKYTTGSLSVHSYWMTMNKGSYALNAGESSCGTSSFNNTNAASAQRWLFLTADQLEEYDNNYLESLMLHTDWIAAQGNGPSTCPSLSTATETYNTSNYAVGDVIYKEIEGLEAGTYQVTFYYAANAANIEGIASGTGIAQAFANDTAYDITVGTSTSMNDSWANGTLITIECTVGADGTLKFGLRNVAEGGNWYTVEAVSLTLVTLATEPEIDAASADATTVMAGQTITLTFPYADPTGLYTLVGESQTGVAFTNTANTADAFAVDITYEGDGKFTFVIPEGVTNGASYSLSLPEGILRFDGINVQNATQTLTFNVLSLVSQSGVYLYNTHSGQFLSRGGEYTDGPATYGQIAATDRYGLPLDITVDDEGFATVKFLDSNLYLYLDTWAFTDGSVAGRYAVNTLLTDDGEVVYQFSYDGIDDNYLYVNDETHNFVASNGNLNGDNNLKGDITRTYWQVFSKDERDAYKAACEEADRIAVAKAAGADTDNGDFSFERYQEGFTYVDATSKVTSAALAGSISGWDETDYHSYNNGTYFTTNSYGTEIYIGDAKLSQTVSGLAAGIYRVTLQGLVRQGGYQNIIDSGLDAYDLSIGFLEANGYQTNLKPWAEDRTKVEGVTLTVSYPNTMEEASYCFDQGLYEKELYTYVGEDGTLALSINCPDNPEGGWMIFRNLTLAQCIPAVEWTMTEVDWGTLILPFDYDLASDGLVAYSCSEVDGNVLVLTPEGGITDIKANTPYIVAGDVRESTTYQFAGVPTNTQDTYTDGLLTGTLVPTTVPEGSNNYVLQNQSDKLAFYLVADEGITCGAYHCYLTYAGASGTGVKLSISFPGSDDATGIEAVGEAVGSGAIYDLSGRKVSHPLRGVYIKDGRKVVVR